MIEKQAENVIKKIHHYLITSLGRTVENATDQEFYRAFCIALRDEIMINWTANSNTFRNKKVRKAYYLSMEYMPGRCLRNNINNIGASELIQCVLKKMARDINKIYVLEPDIGIGNGGLGRLASCFMDALATQQYPALGYGLRYQYGIFEQELWYGVQVERPDCWLLSENPWEFRRDNHAVSVKFGGKIVPGNNSHGDAAANIIDCEKVRALPYDIPIIGYSEDIDFSVLTLRLWSTKESPRNFQLQRFNAGQIGQAAENTSLTDALYPNDNHDTGKRIRLKQEFLLASASLKDIINQHMHTYGNMDDFADKVRIQLNDTHPALALPELMRILMYRFDYSWERAWEVTGEVCSYTNHTILKEALEEWNEKRLGMLLPRQFSILQKINDQLCKEVRCQYPDNEAKVRRMSIIEEGQIKMANLSIYGTHKINGVAEIHSNILKTELFTDFHDLFMDRFTNVTNGVTQRRWLLSCNPLLSAFITKRIGNGWITNFSEIEKLGKYAGETASQEEFMQIKRKNKESYLESLRDRLLINHCQGIDRDKLPILGPDALFDVQIKRIHEYKRQLMNALHGIMLLHELKANPDSRKVQRMVFFGGKAAPAYRTAKEIIRLIYCIARKINEEPQVAEKLRFHFIENYNVSEAEILIPASDLSTQISTAGLEASGTGNMKLAINGAMTIGTHDGANVEMQEAIGNAWWPFSFGASSTENQRMHRKNTYDPSHIYKNNPAINAALTALIDGSLSTNAAEEEALSHIHHTLVKSQQEGPPDKYFVLGDLQDYYETQKRVEELYLKPPAWAEHCLHNIAGMGKFSADESIRKYAKNIWKIDKCPPDPSELAAVREQYSQLDRYHIL
jgi:glycogen phosphorylase